tara:strand:- start:91 stop:759 length:669 start_codon:yes stop_codon:yes gene_type:complete
VKHNYQNFEEKLFHVEKELFTSREFHNIFSTTDSAISKLKEFEKILTIWNKDINLISKSTEPHIWWRHIADTAQLVNLVSIKSKVIIDMGSGAGFPGIILSILGSPEVHLVESVGKKANFLKYVIKALSLDAKVHHSRIEALKPFKVDIVTARALAPLDKLLELSQKFIGKDTLQLYFKGDKFNIELDEARKKWIFDFKTYKSLTNPSSRIIEVKRAKFIGS